VGCVACAVRKRRTGFGGENLTERSLGRPGCKCDNNIKINLKEISYRSGWVHLSQTRDRNHGYKYLPVTQMLGIF